MAGIIEVKDQGKVRIYDADNSNYVDIVVPSTVSSNRTITIPDATFTIPTADTVFSSSTITGQSAETSVADDDLVLISDTSASGALKKMTVANLTANAGVAGISSSADATAMTITDAEKIGIGETTPLGLVHIKQADSGQGTVNADTSQLVIEDNSTAGITLLGGTGGTGAIFFGDSGDNDIGLIEYDHGANSMAFKTNATEQMRLTDNGSMLLGGTATQASTPNIYIHAAGAMIFLRRKTSNGNVAEFINTSNEVKGSITVSSTNTSYNTSSDYRLKENVATMEDATTRLKQLQPKRFNYISDESNTVVDGFLAHEVSSIVPEAITGEKDAIKVWQEGEKLPEGVSVGDNKLDENGNTIPDFQSIDQSKLVPLLVKTIQELEARITTLENA
nr:hypothetical protein [uncultured Mediterranean phage uvMED]